MDRDDVLEFELPPGWTQNRPTMDAPEPTFSDPNGNDYTLAELEALFAHEDPSAHALALADGSAADPYTSFDVDTDAFKQELTRRQVNRNVLIAWLWDALEVGTDYGIIRDKKGNLISDKPSLFQPGAEKIAGYLNLRHTFPDNAKLVDAAIEGKPLRDIVVRCFLMNSAGVIVGEGTGARSASQFGSELLNTRIKMAQKSAFVDAVKRCGGLSEIFSQDLEPDEERKAPIAETVDSDYLLTKARQLFGDENAEKVLESLALRKFKIAGGNWRLIPAFRVGDAIKSLEQKLAQNPDLMPVPPAEKGAPDPEPEPEPDPDPPADDEPEASS